MVFPNVEASSEQKYDRKSELKAFDDTNSGVKGLVDAGVTKVPQIFINPPEIDPHKTSEKAEFIFPVIDLDGITMNPNRHKEIVNKVRDAAETWGFFQVINHGIPVCVFEEMINGTRRFHEQEIETKKQYYTRDLTRRVVYNSNYALYSSPAANWRDSFFCQMAPNPPKPEELPIECRSVFYA